MTARIQKLSTPIMLLEYSQEPKGKLHKLPHILKRQAHLEARHQVRAILPICCSKPNNMPTPQNSIPSSLSRWIASVNRNGSQQGRLSRHSVQKNLQNRKSLLPISIRHTGRTNSITRNSNTNEAVPTTANRIMPTRRKYLKNLPIIMTIHVSARGDTITSAKFSKSPTNRKRPRRSTKAY